jgi:hypothetical protein
VLFAGRELLLGSTALGLGLIAGGAVLAMLGARALAAAGAIDDTLLEMAS